MKKHLNAFNSINILRKKLANNKLQNCRCVSMHNNLNIGCTTRDIAHCSLIKCAWEVN